MRSSGILSLAVVLLTIQVPTLTMCSCLRVRGGPEGVEAVKSTPFVRRNICKLIEKLKSKKGSKSVKKSDDSYYKGDTKEEDPGKGYSSYQKEGDDPGYGDGGDSHGSKDLDDKDKSWGDKDKSWGDKDTNWGDKDGSKSSGSGDGSSYGNDKNQDDPKSGGSSYGEDPNKCKSDPGSDGKEGQKESGSGSTGYRQ